MTTERVAVVTGGGQGIGKAVAVGLSRDGFRVVIADRRQETGEDAAAGIRRERGDDGAALFIETDVANEASVARLWREAADRYGRVDALVNNAGLMIRRPLAEQDASEWHGVIGTNLTGAFFNAKHGAPHLRRAGGGIVNIASTRALMSEPDTEAYAASKGGLVALTHALAISLGPTVTVNCVSPGWIDTSGWAPADGAPIRDIDHRQHPAGRVGRPEDVARLVSFLLDPQNRFMTGANLVLDGGMLRKMMYEE